MSAGLLFFFWDWGGASGSATATAVAIVVPPAHGSGYWPYRPLDDDYWRLWAARFAPSDLAPHAQFDLQVQLADLHKRLQRQSASASAIAALNAEIDDLDTPDLF